MPGRKINDILADLQKMDVSVSTKTENEPRLAGQTYIKPSPERMEAMIKIGAELDVFFRQEVKDLEEKSDKEVSYEEVELALAEIIPEQGKSILKKLDDLSRHLKESFNKTGYSVASIANGIEISISRRPQVIKPPLFDLDLEGFIRQHVQFILYNNSSKDSESMEKALQKSSEELGQKYPEFAGKSQDDIFKRIVSMYPEVLKKFKLPDYQEMNVTTLDALKNIGVTPPLRFYLQPCLSQSLLPKEKKSSFFSIRTNYDKWAENTANELQKITRLTNNDKQTQKEIKCGMVLAISKAKSMAELGKNISCYFKLANEFRKRGDLVNAGAIFNAIQEVCFKHPTKGDSFGSKLTSFKEKIPKANRHYFIIKPSVPEDDVDKDIKTYVNNLEKLKLRPAPSAASSSSPKVR